MGQKKLKRFAELESFSNVFQYPKDMPGRWNEYFNNRHSLVLELACGKGEYTIGLARRNPQINYIGVDLKGNRIWVGARKAIHEQLKNVAFLRIQIDMIPEYFARDEVHEIWITFPDPQLRTGKSKKRLTHPKFLRLYQRILKPGGPIHLKTDSPQLYNFTRKVIEMYGCTLNTDVEDVHSLEDVPEELSITTHYEKLDIAGSKRIHYLRFSLPQVLPDKDMDRSLQDFLRIYERAD